MGLFATEQSVLKVLWKDQTTMHDLLADELPGLGRACTVIGCLGVWRRVESADESPTRVAAALVYDGHRHISDHFIVVYPRVKEWIGKGHEDEEDEHSLVGDGGTHLFGPDVAHVFQAIRNLV